mgnify:CR=1 FL=1
MNNAVDSHIQMPKCVLKRFEDSEHRFCYFDVEKSVIGNNGHAKSLNTQLGYYSQSVEDTLRDQVETPFSELMKFVESIDFNAPYTIVKNDMESCAKRFIYALFSRSPQMVSTLEETSIAFPLLSEQDRHDYSAVAGIALAERRNLLGRFYLTFTVNKTEIPFVLPMCGVYSFKLKGFDLIILPISPSIAITLVDKAGKNQFSHGDTVYMFSLEDEILVNRFNLRAFMTQCKEQCGYVVASTREMLEKLYSLYQEQLNNAAQ